MQLYLRRTHGCWSIDKFTANIVLYKQFT